MIAQFGDLKFEIAADNAILFEDLKLSAGCDTEDKSQNSQKYAARKEGKAVSVTMKVILNAALGADVRNTVMWLQDMAQQGAEQYLSVGGQKLFPFKLMLTKADADSILISPEGTWVAANVSVTFTQSSPEHILQQATETAAATGAEWVQPYEEPVRQESRERAHGAGRDLYVASRMAEEARAATAQAAAATAAAATATSGSSMFSVWASRIERS